MGAGDMSAGDDLLRWASENASGAWESLRDASAYVLSRREDRWRPSRLAASLSSLGHLDIDWTNRRWSVAPPRFALSPGMGLCGYLAGWRPSSLMARYDNATGDHLDLYPFEVNQGNAPHAIFAKCASVEEAYDMAERLGIPIVLDPSAQLAELVELPKLDTLPKGAPPPDEELERFNPVNLSWLAVEERDEPGLYQFELHGQKAFRLRASGDWWIVDRAVGQLATLVGREGVVSWHPGSADQAIGRALSVSRGLWLPDLAERAAVAASGLLPVHHAGRRYYRNVRREVSRRLADALGLTLGSPGQPINLPAQSGAH
jgi:hypothetical protein